MPELPEVETIYRGLAQRMTGSRVQSVTVIRPDLRRVIDASLPARLTGALITGLTRRGKYIIMRSERGDSVIIHLGMSGRLLVTASHIPRAPHTHLILDLPSQAQVRFVDPRRFGSIDIIETSQEVRWPAFLALGPEPLSSDFCVSYLANCLAGKKISLKSALLDQKLVAGLGNIYVCEILFRARVNPFIPGKDVTKPALARLIEQTHHVLTAAIAAGGSTLRDYVGADGQPGAFASLHLVYGREGEACPHCATKGIKQNIVRTMQAGRSSFYCPVCQGVTQN